MFSPAKAIVAGTVIFAIGGAVLLAQPFDQRGPSHPAAGAAAGVDPCTTPISLVSGTIAWRGERPGTERVIVDLGQHIRDYVYDADWNMDDDRLDGEQVFTGEWDVNGLAGINRGTIRVVNDGGSWEGPWTGVGRPGSWQSLISLTGDGGYAGLSATIFAKSGVSGSMEGAIHPTDIGSCDFASMR